jgi:hypothetical protein
MCLSGLFGTYSPDNLRPIINCLMSMEGPLFPCESLVDNLGLLVDTEVRECICIRGSEGCGREWALLAHNGTKSCAADWSEH